MLKNLTLRYNNISMKIEVKNQSELEAFGNKLGGLFEEGIGLVLSGDVGAGKTTLVKSIAAGMGIDDEVSSPSYTLSQTYQSPDRLRLVHYDFYRLSDPGILANELEEVLSDGQAVVAIEWSDIVSGVLPTDHLQIQIVPTSDTSRRLVITPGGDRSGRLVERLK